MIFFSSNSKGENQLNSSKKIKYEGESWDPREVPWREFEQEIDRMYEEYKKLYRDRTESFLLGRGYVKGPEKRNKEHFKWLVHFVVQKWTLRDIADYYSKSNQTVLNEDAIYHGIKSTANLVFIDLKRRDHKLSTK